MDEKEIIEEEWKQMAKKLSMRDVMMIALIEDILPDCAYEDAFDNILEMLLSRYHDISIESIEKLLDAHMKNWDKMF